jgi:hypothetical protein
MNKKSAFTVQVKLGLIDICGAKIL